MSPPNGNGGGGGGGGSELEGAKFPRLLEKMLEFSLKLVAKLINNNPVQGL